MNICDIIVSWTGVIVMLAIFIFCVYHYRKALKSPESKQTGDE